MSAEDRVLTCFEADCKSFESLQVKSTIQVVYVYAMQRKNTMFCTKREMKWLWQELHGEPLADGSCLPFSKRADRQCAWTNIVIHSRATGRKGI